MIDKCPICYSKGYKIRDKVRGDVPIKVYRCDKCYIDFLEIWDEKARVYKFYDKDNYVFKPNIKQGIKMKYNEYDERFENIKPYLSKDKRLLDIGCGDGTFLKMVDPLVGVAEGTEITTYHVNNLRKQGFKIYDCLLHEMQTPEEPYDIICMFALLEHVPVVTEFLEDLKKRFIHEESLIFIEVPNLLDPLTSCYDIPEYRDFFYREYHLYYFTEKSLNKLLQVCGFKCETKPVLQASLTNHFHWLHLGKGQPTTTDMSNVTLIREPIMKITPKGNSFIEILDKVDNF